MTEPKDEWPDENEILLPSEPKERVEPDDYLREGIKMMKNLNADLERRQAEPVFMPSVAFSNFEPPKIVQISGGSATFTLFGYSLSLDFNLRHYTEGKLLEKAKTDEQE